VRQGGGTHVFMFERTKKNKIHMKRVDIVDKSCVALLLNVVQRPSVLVFIIALQAQELLPL